MWLVGSAGSGKTAIAQTTAEELKEDVEGVLLACHFFSRTSRDGKRSDGDCWVPNLVQQMICVFPETLPLVESIIKTNIAVFDFQLDGILQELFLRPLLLAFPSSPPLEQRFSFRKMLKRFLGMDQHRPNTVRKHRPRLIIIDGLDECSSLDKQAHILEAIARVIPKLPIPIRFLIVSRPETHIRTTIHRVFCHITLGRINLDEDQDTRTDLEEYYTDRFDEIRKTHPSLIGQPAYVAWPSRENIDVLVAKSSTQFIFASTVMNYISYRRSHPVDRLGIVLGLTLTPREDRPFLELDMLYRIVLLTVDEADLPVVLVILTLVYMAGAGEFPYLNLHASPHSLEQFLDLKMGDVPRLLDPLVSILALPEYPTQSITMLHASFFDYLRDPARSEELTMPFNNVHTAIAQWIFNEAEKSKSWAHQESSELNNVTFDCFLRHASLAYLSDKLVLDIYAIGDNMTRILLNQDERTSKFQPYIRQIRDLLRSTYNVEEIIVVLMTNSEHMLYLQQMANLVIDGICAAGEKSVTCLVTWLTTNLQPPRPITPLSGKPHVSACTLLLQALLRKPRDILYRHDLIALLLWTHQVAKIGDICELEFSIGVFAHEVVDFLQCLRFITPPQNVQRIPPKIVEELLVKWREYIR
ncbi:hypothetical protein CPB83DRAFT_845698 [Crepidotus variabilis]|uniref:NACHT domain-containing protein n=1 Tax=Crepidotus variabilis TaxID=179855 RepID=A0A9P6JVB0_9AGAR|nr:hypothetical protein CPB83DRAFT_845698 [Crepidotus variabilis]